MFKLNKITNFIDTHPIGRVFRLGKKTAVWKKVTELKTGAKIAIEKDGKLDWDEIIEIKSVGRERVYDIEVEGTHNFVGNGIIAHNTYISDNLGIGATSPASKLDITATGTFAAAGISGLSVGAHTVTLSGANPTTYATFYANNLGAMTLAGTNAGQTVTTASSLYVANPVAGANVTITNNKPINTESGGYLSSVGVWTDFSSREVKENFTELNMDDILTKLEGLAVTSWNYKAQPGVTHIGPVAEDFYSAFDIGNDPQHLAALDTSGVALAGIKALIKKSTSGEPKLTPEVLNLTILGTLEAQGAVTFKTQVEFQGPAIFKALAEFIDKVIFRADVAFFGRATFNSDTAGFAVIPTKANEVNIVFDKEYAQTPIVTASALWDVDQSTLYYMKELGTYILPKQDYIIANVTTKGFMIILEEPAVVDLKFSWTAVAVENAKTVTGVIPTPTPVTTTSGEPKLTPEVSTPSGESVTPEVSTPSGESTPSVNPSATPE